MNKITSILLLTFITISIFGQIRIIDPQNIWSGIDGSIQDVSFTVNPVGTYAEISIYYTTKMSANTPFVEGRQLEFIHNFDLPEDIVFNDSWLWINDYISKGEIYDYSEGIAIYEDIVDRQQDPSILSKISPTQYHFRIYPMFVDSNRTIKLSYLQPLKIVDGKSTVILPMGLIEDSKETPEDLELTLISDDDWSSTLTESIDWQIVSTNNEETTYKYVGTDIGKPTVTLYSKKNEEPYLFDIHEEADEKYFQLHFDPEFEIESESQNVMILYDFNFDNSYLNNKIFPADFNKLINSNDKVIMSYLDFVPEVTSTSWSEVNNNDVLDLLNNGHQSSGSNDIATLLPFTLDVLESMGEDARLLIFSTSRGFDHSSDYTNFKNQILNYIQNMSIGLTVDVLDMSWQKEYNGSNDRGLVSLYDNMAQNHEGRSLILTHQVSYPDALSYMTKSTGATTDLYNIIISGEEGFTYDVFNSADRNGYMSLDSPLSVYGKIIGNGPYTISIDAVHEGNLISQDVVLTPNLESPGEYTSSIWASNYLLHNENNYGLQQEVVDLSIEERLLCRQTVFLCLEQDTLSISSNGGDGSTTSTSSNIETIAVSVSPNPFTNSIKINLPPSNTGSQEYQIVILNSIGEIIADLSDQNIEDTVTWTPNNLKSGIYYVRILNKNTTVTKKIIYITQ